MQAKNEKPIIFFDFEVFPSWTLMCYKNKDEETVHAVSSDESDFSQQVSRILTNAIIMGYNNKN